MVDNFSRIGDVVEESEATRGIDDDLLLTSVPLRPNRGNKSEMLSVRVPAATMRAIEDLAERCDLPVSAMVRGWILRGLAEQGSDSVEETLDRVTAELNRLRGLVTR
jgi:hypothetical protein